MRDQVKSKPYYAMRRLTQALLSGGGLELNRAGTRSRLERQCEEARAEAREARRKAGEARKEAGEARRKAGEARKEAGEARTRLKEVRRRLRAVRKRALYEGGWRPANLRKYGFSPRTVVDVGVYKGTPTLYEAFPEAYHVLVEPLKENEPDLRRILQEYEGEYFLTALGAREEELIINVEPNQTRKSSIHSRTDSYSIGDLAEKRKIPVTTLDALAEKNGFRPPFGLKIDTEGFEHQVIEGAPNFLRQTQFVIAEVVVAEVYEGSYSFADFVGLMDENGFSLCDILHIGRKTWPSLEIAAMDAVFRRADWAR